MALRKIINIDESLCNGCGNCITGCAEGALQLVDGKAKLVKETFCDGFGDCIGTCPTGALTIEERDCEEFDFDVTLDYVREIRGEDGANRMIDSHAKHEAIEKVEPKKRGGCPGSQIRFNKPEVLSTPVSNVQMPVVNKSEISQWPIMLHLVPPSAPFFKNRELAILSTCSSVTSPDVQWRYIRGRAVVVACPKLDRTEGYVDKLAGILNENQIPKVHIIRMEVPCCGGLTAIVRSALAKVDRNDLIVEEVTVSLSGEILKTEKIFG